MKWNGTDVAIESRWMRVTHNPRVSGYPKAGQVIELRGHQLLCDGKYLVVGVTKYENEYPSNCHDIRIDLVGDARTPAPFPRYGGGWNGENILKAIASAR